MCLRHRARNCSPAGAPYTLSMALLSAMLLRSSVSAAAVNAGDLGPAAGLSAVPVAMPARYTCSCSREVRPARSSAAGVSVPRPAAVVAADAEAEPELMSMPGIDELMSMPGIELLPAAALADVVAGAAVSLSLLL